MTLLVMLGEWVRDQRRLTNMREQDHGNEYST